MAVNVELLEDVMQFIEHNQNLWDQSAWACVIVNGWELEDLRRFVAEDPLNPACGTARCFAGHAVAMSGFMPVMEQTFFKEFAATECIHVEDGKPVNWDGEKFPIDAKAAELLGLTGDEAETLFEGDNSLTDLREMVDHLKSYGDLESYDGALCEDEDDEDE